MQGTGFDDSPLRQRIILSVRTHCYIWHSMEAMGSLTYRSFGQRREDMLSAKGINVMADRCPWWPSSYGTCLEYGAPGSDYLLRHTILPLNILEITETDKYIRSLGITSA